jgi:LuxR family transcriptional regulator, maltose regulon positive regulatory protein
MEAQATAAVGASRRRIIKRPRLTRILDESSARIILLVAPAGYGKTTLAHEWLDSKMSAWYRGSPASADVAALAVGLATAAAEIVPGAGERMRQRLRATDRPDEDARILAEMLAEDLEQWPDDAWLVIDDYQFAMDSPACEDFVQVVAEVRETQLFVTTRRRPNWATARRRIYGELEVLNREMLAMTQPEALSLLQWSEDEAPDFLASIQGWPALIGLAALSKTPLAGYLDAPSPDDYFAEELYDSASAGLRLRLCDLALAPTEQLIQRLFIGNDPLLDEGIRLGFLIPEGGSHGLHPALRDFLLARAAERPDHKERVQSIGNRLLEHEAWDDVFVLAREHDSEELFVSLLEQATDGLLAQGRVSTLEHWLNYAVERRIDSEVVDYVESEIAFRNGLYKKAEVLGAHAAQRLGRDHRLASRAYARAGHSAYLSGNRDDASFLLSKALETASGPRDVKDALWGQFLCAVEAERPEGRELLEQFSGVAGNDSGDLVRVKTGELFLTVRGLRQVSPDLLSAIHLADGVNDCLSESSFLNALMWFAVYLGRYQDALDIGARQERLIQSYRLDFALPHLHLRQAMAYRGRRMFRECRASLRKAEASAGPSDAGLRSAVMLAVASTELQQGRPAIAVDLLEREPDTALSPSWQGEYLALRALALAVTDHRDDALQAAHAADSMTAAVEARGLSAFARAVVECQNADHRETDAVRDAFDRAASDHNADCLITAYRAYPQLLSKIWSYSGRPPLLLEIVESARDHALAATAKLPVRHKRAGLGLLSPREAEILGLIRDGLTNAEIAQMLFLSVSTVKVHVRHIFEKLDVRTRTEAAARAADYEDD